MNERIKAALHGAFTENISLKVTALVITVLLWVWVMQDRDTVITALAPLRLEVPSDMSLVTPPLDRVKVSIRGRWSDLNNFEPDKIKPVTIQLTDQQRDALVAIKADAVDLPPGLKVVSIDPSYVRVRMEEEVKRELPIRPQIVGEVSKGYKMGKVIVEPKNAFVLGPQTAMTELTNIPTQGVDVDGLTRTKTVEVPLVIENPAIEIRRGDPAKVTIPVTAYTVQRTLENLPISAVNTSYATDIQPDSIDLTVKGPEELVDELIPAEVLVSLDMSEEDGRPPATYQKQPKIKNLPQGVELIRFHPTDFRVRTSRPIEE